MKRKLLLIIGALGALAPSAFAVPILVGQVTNPTGGNSAANELAVLNSLLPASVADATFGTDNIDVGGQQTSITLNPTGFEYIKLSWGQTWQFYSTIGETAPFTFVSPSTGPQGQQQALSHYTWFNNLDFPLGPGAGPGPGGPGVPDGGSTCALLGATLAAIALVRRRFTP
jgi:hypothetical protein